MINPHIKCSVKRCKHNDQAQHCTLDDIVVGCSSNQASCKADTNCDSFQE
jgi:hypothetical protein